MQMVPFRLNLFGLLALWLQRLTYTEAKVIPVLIAAHRGHSGEEARAAPLMPPRLVHIRLRLSPGSKLRGERSPLFRHFPTV